MAAKKGHKKVGGRGKGAQNKRTKVVMETIEKVLGYLNETIQDDIAMMKPVERAVMWNNLQEYIRPKLARTELTGKDGNAMEITVTKRIVAE
jgi:hypothetical protein